MHTDSAIINRLISLAETAQAPQPKRPKSAIAKVPQSDDEETDLSDATPIADEAVGTAWFIAYTSASNEESERQITIRQIVNKAGITYIIAYCHERNALRQFKLDRISAAHDLATGEILESQQAILNHFTALARCLHSNTKKNAEMAIKDCQNALNILTFLSRCDGQYHPQEEEIILQYIGDQWFEYDLDEATLLLHVRRLYPDTQTYLDAIKSLSHFKSEKHRNKIFRYAMSLIEADGTITADEIAHYQTIKDA